MADRRETSEEIDAAAALWAARSDGGPLNAQDEAELQQWLAGDTRRQGAYLRARAVTQRSRRASALGPGFSRTIRQKDRASDRRRFIMGGGAVAAAVAGGVVWLRQDEPGGTSYASEFGETRDVALPDGSRLILNTDSRVEARFTDSERWLKVVAAEFVVELIEDAARPLRIEVNGMEILSTAGKLAVRALPAQPLRLILSEGNAHVRLPRLITHETFEVGPLSQAEITKSGDWLSPFDVRISGISEQVAAQAQSWRSGQLAFTGQSLASAAAEFARYTRTRIRIADPKLAAEPIVGLFAADNPQQFADIVALSYEAKVRRVDDELIIE